MEKSVDEWVKGYNGLFKDAQLAHAQRRPPAPESQHVSIEDVAALIKEINRFFENMDCPYELSMEAFRSIDSVDIHYMHKYTGVQIDLLPNHSPRMAYFRLDSWFRGITFWMHVAREKGEKHA